MQNARLFTGRQAAVSAFAVAIAAVMGACGDDDGIGPDRPNAGRDYEVWLIDQANSPGQAFGGTVHVYDRAAVSGATAAPAAATIDLGQATAALCLAQTGANPVRPHYLTFNPAGTHAIVSFVASGHVAILDAERRQPVGCVRASAGAGGGRQAHAAVPSTDGAHILVANQNGKLLERITTNYATNSYALDAAATLDLAACTTPSGAPCQSAALRPDAAPIVPTVTEGGLAFVTLRGGGLFVVDARSTPMRIRAEYDSATVRGSGLTGIVAGQSVVVNSGAGFFAYRFDPAAVGATNLPNRPAPTTLVADAVTARDGHGMVAAGGGRYAWIADRGTNVAEVVQLTSGSRTTFSFAGALSADPAPDLADAAPDGTALFFTLRGPNPLSGGPIATGSTPGLAVIALTGDGSSGTLDRVLRISTLDAGGVERADPHAVRVRLKPSRGQTVRLALARTVHALWGAPLAAQPARPRVPATEGAQECDHGAPPAA